ncbi:MAG: sigma factor-like helix-turn-helix DNA-binding protein [Candidatus Howiella sp.]|jgi:predicted DNA-binding protein YlxM (UPF0122 family)
MPKNLHMAVLLDYYGGMLTDRQRALMDLYYNQDLSLTEIAENTGITRQGARDGIKRAESLLIGTEEKLSLAARAAELEETGAKILALCARLSEAAEEETRRSAAKIARLARKISL